jgi:DNA helicase II / ATP-dependent DNA helicase PcrA
VFRLEQNYRSTGTILHAANALIANNTGRLGKTLWTAGEKGEPIRLYAAFNERDEADFVVDQHPHVGPARQPARGGAMLYRSNAQSRVIEEALIANRIPYRVYGGLRFFERAEIKDALAYLRLVSNRADDPSFERVVNLPTRGIGAKTLETCASSRAARRSRCGTPRRSASRPTRCPGRRRPACTCSWSWSSDWAARPRAASCTRPSTT